MKIFTLSLLILLSFISQAQKIDIDPDNFFPQVKLETTMGVIIVELDRIKAPLTVDNFLTYVVKGEYNNTVFHRIVTDFVVQGGGYDMNYAIKKIEGNVYNESGNGLKNNFGTIAMARENRPHTANRQFFFNIADNSSLDPGKSWGYAVFGEIIEGQEILEKIAKVNTVYNEELGWPNAPLEKVILTKATLLPAE
jgi:peptidyl-prolyl cis-trans isomerase A (cyclophilin A)